MRFWKTITSASSGGGAYLKVTIEGSQLCRKCHTF